MDQPESWQAAFEAGMLLRPHDEDLQVEFAASNGSRLIYDGRHGEKHEVRWVPAEGAPVVVQAFGSEEDEAQVLGVSFDGRYLVYSVTWSLRLFESDWSLYVWDSQQQGEPNEIAHSDETVDGQPVQGPLNYPVAHNGNVAWVQVPADTPTESSLYVYRIADQTTEVVSHGGISEVHHMGSSLIWLERIDPQDPDTSRFRAASFDTLEPVELPGPLADIRRPNFPAFTDDLAAWVDGRLRELWVWRTDWPEPVQVVTADERNDEYLQWVNIAGDIVTWTTGYAQFALDLRSGGYTQITPTAASTTADGGPLLIIGFEADLSRGKENARSDQTVVDVRDLPPLPGCG